MKHTIFIIVLSLMLKPVIPVFSYVLNYDYIVKELCENKEKPELQCNGKCHLKKELAKSAEAEKPVSQKKNQQFEAEVLFVTAASQIEFPSITFPACKENISLYSNLYSRLTELSVFHPPAI